MGRPQGVYGEISKAILDAATAGPATVRELAHRAQVGHAAARYTTSRLVQAGELVLLTPPRSKPCLLVRSDNPVRQVRDRSTARQHEALDAICAHWW